MTPSLGVTIARDFTVIGEAVNLTARGVEAAKGAGVEYLFTAAFVERFGMSGLVRRGRHVLRGVAEAVEMFLPADSGEP